MIELELGSTGAEEISVFHKLLLEKGTNPFRLAIWPVDITLQSRLVLPVPPLFPPEPPEPPDPLLLLDGFETPEQAVKTANKAATTIDWANFAAEQGQDMILLLSWSRRPLLKRPSGHVRIRRAELTTDDRPYFPFKTDLATPMFSYLS